MSEQSPSFDRSFDGSHRQIDAGLDLTDRQLLKLLTEDSSRPLKTLAAAVGLSRSSVRERIVRLRQSGIIRRYTIEVDLPGPVVTAVLMVRLKTTPDPQVVSAVTGMTEVIRCYSLSGPIDLLIEVRASAISVLNDSRDAIAVLPGVASVETAFVLKPDKPGSVQ